MRRERVLELRQSFVADAVIPRISVPVIETFLIDCIRYAAGKGIASI
jgi:hypothetical protein